MGETRQQYQPFTGMVSISCDDPFLTLVTRVTAMGLLQWPSFIMCSCQISKQLRALSDDVHSGWCIPQSRFWIDVYMYCIIIPLWKLPCEARASIAFGRSFAPQKMMWIVNPKTCSDGSWNDLLHTYAGIMLGEEFQGCVSSWSACIQEASYQNG